MKRVSFTLQIFLHFSASLLLSLTLFSCEKTPQLSTEYYEGTYKTIEIGNQTWMARNLTTYKYYNDEGFDLLQADTAWVTVQGNFQKQAYCSASTSIYGSYYTYSAAKNACPEGWHLPSLDEWKILTNFISKSGYKGIETKALSSTGGWHPGGVNFDIYQFAAVPAGYRLDNLPIWAASTFVYENSMAKFWSSTELNDSMAYTYTLASDSPWFNEAPKTFGITVRCIKD